MSGGGLGGEARSTAVSGPAAISPPTGPGGRTQPLRIGLVISGGLDIVSGGYIYDRLLVEHLRAAGDEVEVITFPPRPYAAQLLAGLHPGLLRRLSAAGFDVLLQDELDHPALWLLNRRLRSARPPACCRSSALSVDCLPPSRGARPHCPIVAIVHHLRSSEPRPAWQNRLFRRLERAYLRSVDGFVFNSQATRRSVERLVGRHQPAVVAYPAGDRLGEPLSPAEVEWRLAQPGPRRILFVGNVIPRKGLHTLLGALAWLRAAGQPACPAPRGLPALAGAVPGWGKRPGWGCVPLPGVRSSGDAVGSGGGNAPTDPVPGRATDQGEQGEGGEVALAWQSGSPRWVAGGVGWRLVVVGGLDADPGYAAAVRARVARLGLSEAVEFTGRLGLAELRSAYRSAHILAMPSAYEGFGIAYLEGMGFGLPAIAGAVGAAAEVVSHGVDGYIVPPGDAVAVARALAALLDDPERLRRMSLAALARFQRHPTWSESAAAVRALLLRLAGR